jgi:hypothetical protein
MKVLSVTQGEGRVVELTREEFREFAILANALEGKTEGEANWEFQMHDGRYIPNDDVDFKGVFGAVKAFYEAKFRINEMRQLANRLQGFLDNG